MSAYEVNGRTLIAASPQEAIKAYDNTFRTSASEPITCKPFQPTGAPVQRRPEPVLKGLELIGSAFSNRRRAAANF